MTFPLPDRDDGDLIDDTIWNDTVAGINQNHQDFVDFYAEFQATNQVVADALGVPWVGDPALGRIEDLESSTDDLNAAVGIPYSGATPLEDRTTALETSQSTQDSSISNLNTAVGIPYAGGTSLEDRVTNLETSGTDKAVAYGQTNVSVPAGGYVSQVINFPAGRFSVAPHVNLTCGNGRMNVALESVSASSFTLGVNNWTGASVSSKEVYWQAVEK